MQYLTFYTLVFIYVLMLMNATSNGSSYRPTKDSDSRSKIVEQAQTMPRSFLTPRFLTHTTLYHKGVTYVGNYQILALKNSVAHSAMCTLLVGDYPMLQSMLQSNDICSTIKYTRRNKNVWQLVVNQSCHKPILTSCPLFLISSSEFSRNVKNFELFTYKQLSVQNIGDEM